jgi:hypothetical protein
MMKQFTLRSRLYVTLLLTGAFIPVHSQIEDLDVIYGGVEDA